jgi:hypothetical protein
MSAAHDFIDCFTADHETGVNAVFPLFWRPSDVGPSTALGMFAFYRKTHN